MPTIYTRSNARPVTDWIGTHEHALTEAANRSRSSFQRVLKRLHEQSQRYAGREFESVSLAEVSQRRRHVDRVRPFSRWPRTDTATMACPDPFRPRERTRPTAPHPGVC